MYLRFIILAASCLLFCHDALSRTQSAYSPQEIRQALTSTLGSKEASQLIIPFEADENIQRLAASITKGAADEAHKLSALLGYFREQGFWEKYDRDGTKSAIEVIRSGRGNCLSYANLFVAMARSIGLEALFLDGSENNNELDHRQGLLVDYGHILVGVRLGADIQSIDFDGRKKQLRRFEVLSDFDALADYYNNMGFELSRLGGGDRAIHSTEVIHAFELATRIRPRFARAWNNLGVALKKSGQIRAAIHAYRMAAAADPNLPAPHANLGHAWLTQRKIQEAIDEFRAAVRQSPDNAYYRLFLAQALAQKGQLADALQELKNAASLNQHLVMVQLELARLYLKLDRRPDAVDTLQRVLDQFPHHPEAKKMILEAGT